MARPPKKIEEIQTRPPKSQRINGLPIGKPCDYTSIKVYNGGRVGAGPFLFELLYDEYENLMWEELGEDIRARPRIANRDINVRCYGGKYKLAWFYPKKTIKARDRGVDDGIPIDELVELRIENAEIKARLKEAGSIAKIIKDALAGNTDPEGIEVLKKLFQNAKGSTAEKPKEELSPIKQAFADIEEALGTETFTVLKVNGIKWIISLFGGTTMSQQPQTHHVPGVNDHPGAPEGGEKEFIINYPDEVHDEMNAIDWNRTNFPDLLAALRKFGPVIGVYYKE